MAGGMMRYGIPAYRMPRDMLDAEIPRIEQLGVKIPLNCKVEDVMVAKQAGGFDAVFMAIGAHLAKRADIPAREAGKILDAVSYLAAVERGRGAQAGTPGRGLWRWQHCHGRGPHSQTTRRRGDHDHLPPRPRAHAGPCIRG